MTQYDAKQTMRTKQAKLSRQYGLDPYPYPHHRQEERKVHEFAKERALLLGGEFDWRTLDVLPEQTEILVPLPDRRPLDKVVYDEIDALSGIPQRCDLRVARYVRSYYLEHKKQIVGCIFEWDETR